MHNFDYLEEYIFDEKDPNWNHSKHAFFRVTEEEIVEAEAQMGRKFPQELRDFFTEVGYGFVCNLTSNTSTRLMDPKSIANFRLGEGRFQNHFNIEFADAKNHLVFFEVSEVSFLTMDLRKRSELGQCPIFYLNIKIADSLKDFLHKMEQHTDYYIDLVKSTLDK